MKFNWKGRKHHLAKKGVAVAASAALAFAMMPCAAFGYFCDDTVDASTVSGAQTIAMDLEKGAGVSWWTADSAQGATDIDDGTDVTVTENSPTSWFKFVPKESGLYIFTSGESETIWDADDVSGDLFGALYDSNLNLITCDDDSAGDTNFQIISELTAGETYYLCVSGVDESTTTVGKLGVRYTDANDLSVFYTDIISISLASMSKFDASALNFNIYNDDTTLVSGQDYSITGWTAWDDDEEEYAAIDGKPSEFGTYQAIMEGKGDYHGTIAVTVIVNDKYDLSGYTGVISDYTVLDGTQPASIDSMGLEVYGMDENGDSVLLDSSNYTFAGWYRFADEDEDDDVLLGTNPAKGPSEIGDDYYLRLTGAGKYKGDLDIEFRISKENNPLSVTDDGYQKFAVGDSTQSVLQSVTVRNSFDEIIKAEDYTAKFYLYTEGDGDQEVTGSTFNEAGNYTVEITQNANGSVGYYYFTVYATNDLALGVFEIDSHKVSATTLKDGSFLDSFVLTVRGTELSSKDGVWDAYVSTTTVEGTEINKKVEDLTDEEIDSMIGTDALVNVCNLELRAKDGSGWVGSYEDMGYAYFYIYADTDINLLPLAFGSDEEVYEFFGIPMVTKTYTGAPISVNYELEGVDPAKVTAYWADPDEGYEIETPVLPGGYGIRISAEGYTGELVIVVEVDGPQAGSQFEVGSSSYQALGDCTIYDESEASIIGTSKAGKVVVGSQIELGACVYNVTAISNKAFAKNKKVKSLVIGENVAGIGKAALKGATNCKTVTIKSKKLTKASIKNLLKGGSVKTVKCAGKAKKVKGKYAKWAKAAKKGVKVK